MAQYISFEKLANLSKSFVQLLLENQFSTRILNNNQQNAESWDKIHFTNQESH